MSAASEALIAAAIIDDYQQVGLTSADWSPVKDKLKIDVYADTLLDEDALIKRLHPYTIVCSMRERTKFTARVLDRLPNLKLLTTTGMRNAAIDTGHAKQNGIIVSGSGSSGDSTLEHIWTLILATARYLTLEDNNVKASRRQWQSVVPVALAGRTLGVVGVGNLGKKTANIAKAFGMHVLGWSPNLTRERAEAAGVDFAETKEELFGRSDIVSLHLVLSDKTRGVITATDLGLLKPTAFFINTSRGPLIDEQALVNVLRERKIAGAGLDVFDVEPLPLDHPLRKLDNVTLTPHLGYVSDTNYARFWGDTVENIAGFLNGHPKRVLP